MGTTWRTGGSGSGNSSPASAASLRSRAMARAFSSGLCHLPLTKVARAMASRPLLAPALAAAMLRQKGKTKRKGKSTECPFYGNSASRHFPPCFPACIFSASKHLVGNIYRVIQPRALLPWPCFCNHGIQRRPGMWLRCTAFSTSVPSPTLRSGSTTKGMCCKGERELPRG